MGLPRAPAMTKGGRPSFWLYRQQQLTPVSCPFFAMFFLNPLIDLSRGKPNAPFNVVKGNPLLTDQLVKPDPRDPQLLGKVVNGQGGFHLIFKKVSGPKDSLNYQSSVPGLCPEFLLVYSKSESAFITKMINLISCV
jgi:hypothetical protein